MRFKASKNTTLIFFFFSIAAESNRHFLYKQSTWLVSATKNLLHAQVKHEVSYGKVRLKMKRVHYLVI